MDYKPNKASWCRAAIGQIKIASAHVETSMKGPSDLEGTWKDLSINVSAAQPLQCHVQVVRSLCSSGLLRQGTIIPGFMNDIDKTLIHPSHTVLRENVLRTMSCMTL